MKRLFLFLFLLNALLHIENAQAQKFKMGIIGGVTSSQISGDGFYGFNQFGGIAGIEVSYKINKNWSSALGLQFNQKGARTYLTEKNSILYKLRVNYVEVPFTFKYRLDKFQLGTGLYFGVKTNQKESSSNEKIHQGWEFKPFDFGGQVALNYLITENWQVELRYQNSFIPVRKHKATQAYSPSLFIFGDWHQNMLNKGQYFSSLSLVFRFTI